MMPYLVIYLPKAEKFFHKAPKKLALRIVDKVDQLALNPLAPNTNLKKLQDPLDGYRLRVGDHRVIYILDHLNRKIIVTKIDHRSAIYS